jgi:hypothetical protein
MTTKLNTSGIVFDDASTQNSASDYRSTTYTSPAVYTKPSNLKAIRVTVVGGGGAGGPATATITPQGKSSVTYNSRGGSGGGGGTVVAWIDQASIPASPVAVTVSGVAGTSSFGALASATGGSTGDTAGSNVDGSSGAGGTATVTPSPTVNGLEINGTPGSPVNRQGYGGASVFGSGGVGGQIGDGNIPGAPGAGVGGGGSGGVRNGPGTSNGGSGTSGVVIVEEFF